MASRIIQGYYKHFGYLKEFIGDDIKDIVNYIKCESFEELQELIGIYIEEYNNDIVTNGG
ncbi:hypothetical protein [Neobacillus vireti]|uniref:hypothetical protein n=1 Tax=Neobacillus vireti TaxID=220686 RepID=UPI002FFE1C74